MASATMTSAQGVLSLLDEPELALKTYALQQLNVLVPEFWPGACVAKGATVLDGAVSVARPWSQAAQRAFFRRFFPSRDPAGVASTWRVE